MNHPSQDDAAIEAFISKYPPSDVVAVGEPFLDYAATRLPDVLVELYRRFGLGWFGRQELLLVDPSVWMPVVQAWLGADAATVPFAVTSFGHVYHLDSSGQVQCLDPHYLANTVVAGSVAEFFGEHLPSQGSHLADLVGPRGGAESKLGALEAGELYHFEPVLALGGVVSPDSLAKADGVSQLLRAHRLVRESKAF